MIVKIRTKPIEVFYLTGDDAHDARLAADDEGSGPCFTTAMQGDDGFAWNTCEEFEADFAQSFGADKLPELPKPS